MLDRLTIQVTERPEGALAWRADDLVAFVLDCADHGVAAVSLTGGEPLSWDPLPAVLEALEGAVHRAVQTGGGGLEERRDALVAAAPDRVWFALDDPGSQAQVERVVAQALQLEAAGIATGVDLWVRRSEVGVARAVVERLAAAGIAGDRISFRPERGPDAPSPRDVAKVAGSTFHATSCLFGCGRSPRFCALDAAGRVGWCASTAVRRPVEPLSWQGLQRALHGLRLSWCGLS